MHGAGHVQYTSNLVAGQYMDHTRVLVGFDEPCGSETAGRDDLIMFKFLSPGQVWFCVGNA